MTSFFLILDCYWQSVYMIITYMLTPEVQVFAYTLSIVLLLWEEKAVRSLSLF